MAVDGTPIHSQVLRHLLDGAPAGGQERPHELAYLVGRGAVRVLEDRVEVLLGVARHPRISLGQSHVERLRRAHEPIYVTPEVDGTAEESNVGDCRGWRRVRKAYPFWLPGSAQ